MSKASDAAEQVLAIVDAAMELETGFITAPSRPNREILAGQALRRRDEYQAIRRLLLPLARKAEA
jgi:hypothetical protein